MRSVFVAAAASAMLLCPSAMAQTCNSLQLVTSVDLQHSKNGLQALVPVTIGNIKKFMLLDTGADASIISARAVQDLALVPHAASQYGAEIHYYSLTGAKMDTYVNTSFSLGRLFARQELFMVAPESESFSADPDVVGILGADILDKYDVSVDFGTNKLDLLEQDHCDGKVVYWKTDAIAIIPFRFDGRQITFPATLDDKKITAILDTGASTSVISRPIAERTFGLKIGSADTPVAGEMNGQTGATTWHHTFKALDFDGITILNPEFGIIPDLISAPMAQPARTGTLIPDTGEGLKMPILVGFNVLRHLHVYIAYKEHKLYITPATAPAPTGAASQPAK